MRDYDPNLIHHFARKDVKLTFQQGTYKGTAIFHLGGNTNGADLFESVAQYLQDNRVLETLLSKDACQLNFPLESLGEEDDSTEYYRAVFIDDQGNQCEIEDEAKELASLLVSMEVINIEKEDEDW